MNSLYLLKVKTDGRRVSIIVLSIIGNPDKVCAHWNLCLYICFGDLAYAFLKSMKGQIVLMLVLSILFLLALFLSSTMETDFVDSVLETLCYFLMVLF